MTNKTEKAEVVLASGDVIPINQTQLTPANVSPKDMIAVASEQAKVLCNLIEKQKLYSNIQGKKYVKVEGWVPLARMNGVIPKEVSNEAKPDGSYVARVQLVRLDTGAVITEASGECGGEEEPVWQKRAPYARRSMAATRATGKACRLAYSWIVALAGFEPTPAEEISDVDYYLPAIPPKKKEIVRPENFPKGPEQIADDLKTTPPKGSPISVSSYNNASYIWVFTGRHFNPEQLTKFGLVVSKNQSKFFCKYDRDIMEMLIEHYNQTEDALVNAGEPQQ